MSDTDKAFRKELKSYQIECAVDLDTLAISAAKIFYCKGVAHGRTLPPVLQPMETAPKDGTEITLHYKDKYSQDGITYKAVKVIDAYWKDKSFYHFGNFLGDGTLFKGWSPIPQVTA